MSCAVKTCKNSKRLIPPGSSISFHLFPRDETQFKLWLEHLNLPKTLVWKRSLVVCSKHFPANAFVCTLQRKSLSKKALPFIIKEEPVDPIKKAAEEAAYFQSLLDSVKSSVKSKKGRKPAILSSGGKSSSNKNEGINKIKLEHSYGSPEITPKENDSVTVKCEPGQEIFNEIVEEIVPLTIKVEPGIDSLTGDSYLEDFRVPVLSDKPLTKSDFDNICRCCLSSLEEGMAFLNSWHLEIYCAITSLQFNKNDTLPKMICEKCTTTMYRIKKFGDVCKASDAKLNSVLNEIPPKSTIQKKVVKVNVQKSNEVNEKKLERNDNSKEPPNTENELIYIINEEKAPDFIPNEQEKDTLKPTKVSKTKKPRKVIMHICNKCGKNFRNSSALKTHQITHMNLRAKVRKPKLDPQALASRFACFTCKTNFKNAILRDEHYKDSEFCVPKKYVCEVCNKGFLRPCGLKNHKAMHSDARAYSCKMCDKTFKHSPNLKWHERMHEKDKLLKHLCNICGKKFTLPCFLKQHMEKHTKSGSYICETCGKHFTSKENFRAHVYNKHKNLDTQKKEPGSDPVIRPKDFLCTYCGKSFRLKCLLEQHINTHTGAKPYKCPHCPKTFGNIGGRALHIRIHLGLRPYKCNLCNKSFRQLGHLKAHKLSHSGAKPYQCNTCGNRFVSATNLRLHMPIHTGDKPLKCPHCGEGFADYKVRMVHVKEIHQRESSSKKEALNEHEDEGT